MSRELIRPPRVGLAEADVADQARRELRRGTSGVDLELGGLSVRAGDVPLFRRARDGGLLQCLRLVIRSSEERGPVRFAAREGERLLDSAALATTEGEQALRLFLPEASERRTVTLSVEGAGELRGRSAVEIEPQRKWRVFVIHHSHLDVGYTDPQPVVLQHHLRYLDSVLDLAEETDGWPEAARFRWNVEANWPLGHWLAARTKALREVMLERVRQGRVEVCALPYTLHTEACSIDELARQLVPADELRERCGIPIVTAMQTDVPGTTAGLVDLLVDAGVRYLAVAHNYAGRAVPYLSGGQELTRPFWWRSRGGGRLLVWYTDSPHGVAYLEGNLLGLAESYDLTLDCLPEYLAALAGRPYPYVNGHSLLGAPVGLELTRRPYPHDVLHLRVQGAIADNAPPSLVPAEIVRAWNAEWAYPELRMATNRDFFSCAEERLGERLQSHSGDWTDWWADGLGSGARMLGLSRRAQGALRSAQTLHALADALGDDEPTAWRAEADRAYESLGLFDEHTWGARVPWGDDLSGGGSGAVQWERKAAFAHSGHDRAASLLEAAASRLAHSFRGSKEEGASVVVFNPSSVARTDLVRVFVPSSRCSLERPFALVDEFDERALPHAVEPQEDPTHRPRGQHLCFVAHEVPPLGYRRYVIVEGRTPLAPTGPGERLTLESEHYRLEVDPGEGCAVRLLDVALSRDLVDSAAAFGFGQFVYDRYAGAPALRRDLLGQLPDGGPWLLGERTTGRFGVVSERSSNAVEERITLRLVADGVAWLETSYSLPHGIRRMEIVNRLAKVPTAAKESIYFAFPFAARSPEICYEVTGGVDGPAAARVPGSARHVRAVRHWVTLQDAAATVAWGTLEAPLVELGSIFLPYAPYPETVHRAEGSVFSWAMNNVWDTNFPSRQGGQTVFRYAVSSASPEACARELGMQVGAALAQPLVGVICAGRATRPPAPSSGSFCCVDRADVEVVTVTGSRRGHDLVIFLRSLAVEEVEVRISFPEPSVARVLAGTFLERDLREVADGGEARLRIRPGQCLAVAVDLRRP